MSRFAKKIRFRKEVSKIIKYGSKIFIEPDLEKRAKETNTAQTIVEALDVVLTSFKGKKIFDGFGSNMPKSQKSKKDQLNC